MRNVDPMINRNIVTAVWLGIGTFGSYVSAAVVWTPPGQNLAANKPYILNSDPPGSQANFYLTKGNDEKDLTDGKFSDSERMWIDKACVAWAGGPQFITFDLSEVKLIGGVGNFGSLIGGGPRKHYEWRVVCLE